MPQSDLEERYGPALEAGRKLFARAWVFVLGVPSMKFLPPEGPLEVAFAGRSNVGKSSLINAILGQKNIARTSNTPGRTQELNYFIPEAQSETDEGEVAPVALVDMPGYGFAKAPKAQVEAWTKLIFSYLRGRTTLRRVFVLIDSRHGVKANDEEILAMLDEAAVSYQIVLTKADKPKKNELEKVIAQTEQAVSKRPAAFPGIILTSSEKGDGISEVRAAIAEAIAG